MFKNYLTYQLALSFDQSCRLLELPTLIRESLIGSSQKMTLYLSRSLHTKDQKEELKNLCTSLLCLRDCKEILESQSVEAFEIIGRYEVLHARLEQICLEVAESEGGQLRIFG